MTLQNMHCETMDQNFYNKKKIREREREIKCFFSGGENNPINFLIL